MIMKREDPLPPLETRLSEALYTIYVELGGDTDGAKNYKELFGSLTSPSPHQLVMDEFEAKLAAELAATANSNERAAQGALDDAETYMRSNHSVTPENLIAYGQARATLELAKQQRSANIIALYGSKAYQGPTISFNLEEAISEQAIRFALIQMVGRDALGTEV